MRKIHVHALAESDLVDIWRSQPPERALMQPMSLAVFDQMVLAKQYFDPAGMAIALIV